MILHETDDTKVYSSGLVFMRYRPDKNKVSPSH